MNIPAPVQVAAAESTELFVIMTIAGTMLLLIVGIILAHRGVLWSAIVGIVLALGGVGFLFFMAHVGDAKYTEVRDARRDAVEEATGLTFVDRDDNFGQVIPFVDGDGLLVRYYVTYSDGRVFFDAP